MMVNEREMLFSERRKLAEEFEKWADKHQVEKSPFSVICFIQSRFKLIPKEG